MSISVAEGVPEGVTDGVEKGVAEGLQPTSVEHKFVSLGKIFCKKQEILNRF